MGDTSQYIYLVRIDTTGQRKVVVLDSAQTFWQRQFKDTFPQSEDFDQNVQKLLWNCLQQPPEQDEAKLCLRCYVSWQIERVCWRLVEQFGTNYDFQVEDLLPLVLTDTGQKTPRYRSLGQEIVESFNPERGSLNAWVSLRVKHNSDLNQFLLEQGLYLVSDWAILNDTQPRQLQRILGEFFTMTPTEIRQNQDLLHCYHGVYRRDRLRQRQRKSPKRCTPPTPDQLQEMAQNLPFSPTPRKVLTQLQNLANQLRQYRIHVRGGNLPATSLDVKVQNSPSLGDRLASPAPDTETEESEQFLTAFRQQFEDCLEKAIRDAITHRCQTFTRRNSPQKQQFLIALHLFHCQGQTMGEIAQQVGLKAQYQVTRLLKLKTLRREIEQHTVNCLQGQVLKAAEAYCSLEQIKALEGQIISILSEQVASVMETAQTETYLPKDRPTHNRFVQHLCSYLRTLNY